MNISENTFRYKSVHVSLSLVGKKFLQANVWRVVVLCLQWFFGAGGQADFESGWNRHNPSSRYMSTQFRCTNAAIIMPKACICALEKFLWEQRDNGEGMSWSSGR